MYRYIKVFEGGLKTVLVGLFVIVFGFAAIVAPEKVSAAFSFSLNSAAPLTVASVDQEIVVNLTIINLSSESFFRVAFQPSGGGAYFGYIKNELGNWSKIKALDGDCSGYYKVSDLSTTTLALSLKLGSDSTVTNGPYKIVGHKFTNTGTCPDTESTNFLVVDVTLSTPTPIATPAATPTVTPMPTSIPTLTPTPTVTPKPTVKPTAKPLILGEETSPPESSAPPDVQNLRNSLKTPDAVAATQSAKAKLSPVAFIFIGVGIVLVGTSAFFLVRNYRKEYTEGSDEKVY